MLKRVTSSNIGACTLYKFIPPVFQVGSLSGTEDDITGSQNLTGMEYTLHSFCSLAQNLN